MEETDKSYYIVKSNVHKLAREFSVSKDFEEALNLLVQEIVLKACVRAKANHRNTLLSRDL